MKGKIQVSLACCKIVSNNVFKENKAYLCETGVGYPILDQQGDSVVKVGNSLKLQGRGQGGGGKAGED